MYKKKLTLPFTPTMASSYSCKKTTNYFRSILITCSSCCYSLKKQIYVKNVQVFKSFWLFYITKVKNSYVCSDKKSLTTKVLNSLSRLCTIRDLLDMNIIFVGPDRKQTSTKIKKVLGGVILRLIFGYL